MSKHAGVRGVGVLGHVMDVVDGIPDSPNFIGILVGNFNTKFLLDSHDNLNRIQTIKSQIICEM
jgi:hypothetical protein